MHTCSVGGLGRVQAGRLGRVEAGAAALKGNLLAARLVARTGRLSTAPRWAPAHSRAQLGECTSAQQEDVLCRHTY